MSLTKKRKVAVTKVDKNKKMNTNNSINTILLPVISALATATIGLLVGGQTVYGLIAVVVTLAASYTYEVLP